MYDIASVANNLLWGAAPLLFMALGRAGASSWEIVAHRAMWSAPWAALLVLLAGQGEQVKRAFSQPRTLARHKFVCLPRPKLVNMRKLRFASGSFRPYSVTRLISRSGT